LFPVFNIIACDYDNSEQFEGEQTSFMFSYLKNFKTLDLGVYKVIE
jgi:hypothetical protein